MATSEVIEGPTPNGGVRAELIFLDDDHQLVDRSVATQVEVIEYDADGKVLLRTYGMLGKED